MVHGDQPPAKIERRFTDKDCDATRRRHVVIVVDIKLDEAYFVSHF
jgi:hypothetical protein